MRRLYPYWRAVLLIILVAMSLTSAPTKRPYTPREIAFFADDQTVQFVRPGLTITINSASIAADGTITTTYTLSDPAGAPLDSAGITTPGTIGLSFIGAVLPAGQTQYTAYTTRTASGSVIASTIQAGADSGGTTTPLGPGQYRYVFATKAPSGFDATATHTIGIYGSRDLTVYNLSTNYASATFNFVPNGATVSRVHDLIKTESCNACHDQLSFHGGSRRGIEMCVLCHTPQTVDPDTGNTLDLKVMAHKIHMGSSLPSVIAGKPYQIIGRNGAISDYSTVVHPADVRRCESCHSQTTGAAQATAYLTRPTRATCGACHDDVDFASGKNHAGGPQFSDNQCSTCHIPQGEIDFDASIKGAHVVPTESSLLSGLIVKLTKVQNGTAGTAPVVSFTVTDKKGTAVALSKLGSISLVLAGPTSDYGYTSFGSDTANTPGYVSESATGATCGSDGTCVYTFQHPVPAKATGTYAIGVEARRTETILPGTTKEQSVQYGATNQVSYFAVDKSTVAARRQVVATSSCNMCHASLSEHGTLRNQTEYCVLCHNPSNTDAVDRANADNPADKALPPQGVNFNLLVHRIHTGQNLPPERPYVVVGFGGSHNDFSHVRYAPFNANGSPGDTRNCTTCHVNSSELNFPTGKNAVVDPQGPINPIQPISSACTGCHADISAASHALSNTTPIGESCTVCHAQGSSFAVDKMHAQY